MMDKYALLVQNDFDGGDSPHRGGIWAFYLACKARQRSSVNGDEWLMFTQLFLAYYKHCRTEIGEWIRHPEPLLNCEWQKDPKFFSRDQGSRLMLGFCFGTPESKAVAKEYYLKVIKRSLTHQNGDLIGFGELGFMIRLFSLWYLYPLLLILDFRFVADVFLRDKFDGASLFIPDLIYSKNKYVTPWIYLAAFIIKRKPEIQDEMMLNHSIEKNGCVELQQATIYFFKELKKWTI